MTTVFLNSAETKALGVAYDALDAKALKGADFDALFVTVENGTIAAIGTDRYTMIEWRRELDTPADPVSFVLSPAQLKALKAAKRGATIQVKDSVSTVAVDAASIVFDFSNPRMLANADKFWQFFADLFGEVFEEPQAAAVSLDLARLGRLAKIPEDWRMTATPTNKPIRFEAPFYRALIQPKRASAYTK